MCVSFGAAKLALVQISRYYVCILFSRYERAASANPPGAERGGKTVFLCLPAVLDSLCLTSGCCPVGGLFRSSGASVGFCGFGAFPPCAALDGGGDGSGLVKHEYLLQLQAFRVKGTSGCVSSTSSEIWSHNQVFFE